MTDLLERATATRRCTAIESERMVHTMLTRPDVPTSLLDGLIVGWWTSEKGHFTLHGAAQICPDLQGQPTAPVADAPLDATSHVYTCGRCAGRHRWDAPLAAALRVLAALHPVSLQVEMVEEIVAADWSYPDVVAAAAAAGPALLLDTTTHPLAMAHGSGFDDEDELAWTVRTSLREMDDALEREAAAYADRTRQARAYSPQQWDATVEAVREFQAWARAEEARLRSRAEAAIVTLRQHLDVVGDRDGWTLLAVDCGRCDLTPGSWDQPLGLAQPLATAAAGSRSAAALLAMPTSLLPDLTPGRHRPTILRAPLPSGPAGLDPAVVELTMVLMTPVGNASRDGEGPVGDDFLSSALAAASAAVHA